MKQEPRPAIHMENFTVGWPQTLGGRESQGISWEGQTVLSRLMESQICHPPARSVALCGLSSEKGQWPLPTKKEIFLKKNVIGPGLVCLSG